MHHTLTITSYLFLLRFFGIGVSDHTRETTDALSLWNQVVARARVQAEDGLQLLYCFERENKSSSPKDSVIAVLFCAKPSPNGPFVA